MKTYKRWSEIKFKGGEQARQRAEREAREILLEEDLRGIREAAGKTQAELAEILRLTQSQISVMEAREDHRLSTLRRYVEALGGELEVIANFGDRRVRLHGV